MKVLYIIITLSLFCSCRLSNTTEDISTDIISNPLSPESVDSEEVAEMNFESMEIDLGTISQGEKHNVVFEFENEGPVSLFISAVNASCGCTLPKGWPSEEVRKGESGKIEATFDSSTKNGETVSEITVVANTFPSSTILLIKANVIAPQ